MKILFTGASSFTGFWFVRELAQRGHSVTAVFSKSLEEYSGLRRERVDLLKAICEPVFECRFGSDRFLSLVEGASWDCLCHHAAEVTNYKSLDFNVIGALENNTHHIREVLKELNGAQMVLTGSVFEPGEGIGSDSLGSGFLGAVSPYGVSKGLTAQLIRFEAGLCSVPLKKFVIPNPFGPFEEPRFTTYLANEWLAGKTAKVSTPDYVRDNIPVTLLAKAYGNYVEEPVSSPFSKLNPSYYVDSQGAFTARFSNEMKRRFGLSCAYELAEQKLFTEPKVRINDSPLDPNKLNWSHEEFWNDLAGYYQKVVVG